MFWYWIDVLALKRLGLGRPFRLVLLTVFLGCAIAGVIYTAVVIHALAERNRAPHVHRPVR